MDDTLEESLSDMNNDVSESALELVSLMQTFMDDYFSDEYEVLRFNINFLESNGFTYQTKIDYMNQSARSQLDVRVNLKFYPSNEITTHHE